MAVLKVDTLGKTCPIPLIEARKAFKRAETGDIVIIVGDHQPSKKEIPMAIDNLGHKLLETNEKDGTWELKVEMS